MAVVSSRGEMLGEVPQRAQPSPLVATILLGALKGLPRLTRRRVGVTASLHGPYAWGYTRATLAGAKGGNPARRSKTQKSGINP